MFKHACAVVVFFILSSITAPSFAQINGRLGVINFPKDDERTVPYLDELGAGFVRWNIRWEEVEPEKGVYDFDWLENQMSQFADRQILVMMTTRNPLYCAPFCEGDPQLEEYPYAGGLPNDLNAYEAFISAFVERFGPVINFLEIDNEINEYGAYWQDTILNYKDVLLAAHHAVQQSSFPDLPVVVAGFSSGHLNRLIQGDPFVVAMTEEILSTGAFDFLDLHFYHRYEDIDAKISWLKERGYSDLISTECSGPDLIEGPVSDFEAEKSVQLVKRFSILLANDLQKMAWFSFVNLPNEGERFSHLGLVNEDFSRNPVFYTYELYNRKVGQALSVTKIADGKYQYLVNDRPVLVLWNDSTPGNFNAKRLLSTKNALVTHIITDPGQTDGETEVVPTNRIRLNAFPVFVEEYNK